jgi:hypothetical protein
MAFMRRDQRKSDQRVDSKVQLTLGPFYAADVAGTASTFGSLAYFNTATAVSLSTREMIMKAGGRIVGIALIADVDVTAGTLTARASIDGTAVAFQNGAVVLNTTDVKSKAIVVPYPDGLPFNAGQAIGANVVTVGMTPTTINIAMWVIVALDV